MNGHIFQLNVSHGGVPKLPINEAVLTTTGLIGDRQAHPRFHGGPERALCLYSRERIAALRAEGHPIAPGTAGENVTVEGIDWSLVVPGCHLLLGDEVLIEISSYTQPCQTIAASFVGGNFKRIAQKQHPGESRVYARVLRAGRLMVGQSVRLLLEPEAAEATGRQAQLRAEANL